MEAGHNIHLKTLWKELEAKGYPGADNKLFESLTYYGISVGKRVQQAKLPQHAGTFVEPSAAVMAF